MNGIDEDTEPKMSDPMCKASEFQFSFHVACYDVQDIENDGIE